jgi:hypothetical protein
MGVVRSKDPAALDIASQLGASTASPRDVESRHADSTFRHGFVSQRGEPFGRYSPAAKPDLGGPFLCAISALQGQESR